MFRLISGHLQGDKYKNICVFLLDNDSIWVHICWRYCNIKEGGGCNLLKCIYLGFYENVSVAELDTKSAACRTPNALCLFYSNMAVRRVPRRIQSLQCYITYLRLIVDLSSILQLQFQDFSCLPASSQHFEIILSSFSSFSAKRKEEFHRICHVIHYSQLILCAETQISELCVLL